MSNSTLMQGAKLRTLDLKKLDTSIQTRSEIRAGAVAEYATLIKEQRERRCPTGFPAPIVYEVGDRFLLASGHHRVKAHLVAGVTELECEVRQGDELDAIKAGIAENSKQGERLTRADRQHAMTLVLQRHGNLSNRALAEICDVSEGTIRNWRDSLPGAQTTQERIGRDGKSYPAAVSQPRIDRPVANPSPIDLSGDTSADHLDVDDGCDSIEFPDEDEEPDDTASDHRPTIKRRPYCILRTETREAIAAVNKALDDWKEFEMFPYLKCRVLLKQISSAVEEWRRPANAA